MLVIDYSVFNICCLVCNIYCLNNKAKILKMAENKGLFCNDRKRKGIYLIEKESMQILGAKLPSNLQVYWLIIHAL